MRELTIAEKIMFGFIRFKHEKNESHRDLALARRFATKIEDKLGTMRIVFEDASELDYLYGRQMLVFPLPRRLSTNRNSVNQTS